MSIRTKYTLELLKLVSSSSLCGRLVESASVDVIAPMDAHASSPESWKSLWTQIALAAATSSEALTQKIGDLLSEQTKQPEHVSVQTPTPVAVKSELPVGPPPVQAGAGGARPVGAEVAMFG
eukprot:2520962-Pyramimonas_sp.AAC.1